MFKIALALGVAIAFTLATPSPARISPRLLEAFQNGANVDVIVSFKAKTAPILNKIQKQSFASRGARITELASNLQALSAASQESVLKFLSTQGKTVKSFWITNKVFVKDADLLLVNILAALETVDAIIPNTFDVAPLPTPSCAPTAPRDIQWGVDMVEAPDAWNLGFTGRGVVVGILDTGVGGTHEILRDNYRQTRGWLDTVDCTLSPTDLHGHGTHVMGSIVGRNGVGVAPEANWMACRAPLGGYDTYLTCGEFFLCPTHANGTEPNCSVAPHVVNNSWGKVFNNEDFMDELILAWNAAGIIAVFSNGNRGPTCASAGYPASTNLPLIAVGASDDTDRLAYFSSRGPGAYSGASTIRPDVTAPGYDIVSAAYFSDTELWLMSGTSMAAPHVAGVVALLLTNGTDLPYDEVTRLIFDSAKHIVAVTVGNCGGIPETEYPNNAVGHGRITALGAVTRFLETRRN